MRQRTGSRGGCVEAEAGFGHGWPGLASPAQPSPTPYLEAVPSHLPLMARLLLQ